MTPDFQSLDTADTTQIIALWEKCGLVRPWNPPEQDIAHLLAHPTADILVAKHKGRVKASVAVGYDGHRGWVYYLATDPAQQGAGLGRAAMKAAEDWLRARSVPKIQLMVRETNKQVTGFYAALGYKDSAVRVYQKWLSEDRAGLYAAGRHDQ